MVCISVCLEINKWNFTYLKLALSQISGFLKGTYLMNVAKTHEKFKIHLFPIPKNTAGDPGFALDERARLAGGGGVWLVLS